MNIGSSSKDFKVVVLSASNCLLEDLLLKHQPRFYNKFKPGEMTTMPSSKKIRWYQFQAVLQHELV